MKKSKLLSAAALSLLVFCLAPQARADQLADIKAAGKITGATEMHFAPFDILDGTDYKGIDRDIFDEVAKELGVKPEYSDLPWESVLPGLEAKKFDFVVAPVTITAERMKRYAFSLPIGDATVAMVKQADDSSISKPEDLAGKAAGAQKGSAQLEQLKAFSATLPKPIDIREYVNQDEGLADVAAGRIQAYANSLPLMGYAAQQRQDVFALVMPPFGTKKYFAWVLRPGDDSKSLQEAINAALLKMHQDGRLDAINKKWLGVSPELPTTPPQVQ